MAVTSMIWIAAIALTQPSPEASAPVSPPPEAQATVTMPTEGEAPVAPPVAPSVEAPPPVQPAVWLERPTIGQSDYPSAALQGRVSGTASLQCTATPEGVPTGCTVLSEDPPEHGFGPAAIVVVERARLNPNYVAGVEQPATFRFRIPFALAMSDPVIIVPGDQVGAATLRCALSQAGSAIGCVAVSESPDRQGIGQQAIAFLENTPLPEGLVPVSTPGQVFTIQVRFDRAQPGTVSPPAS